MGEVKPKRCNIPARSLPPCDLEWGHDGRMHANAGDGFYALEYEDEHKRRQQERAAKAGGGERRE